MGLDSPGENPRAPPIEREPIPSIHHISAPHERIIGSRPNYTNHILEWNPDEDDNYNISSIIISTDDDVPPWKIASKKNVMPYEARAKFISSSMQIWGMVTIKEFNVQWEAKLIPSQRSTRHVEVVYVSEVVLVKLEQQSAYRRKLVKNIGGLIAFFLPLPSPPVPEIFYMQLI